jgi:hypothetical protein
MSDNECRVVRDEKGTERARFRDMAAAQLLARNGNNGKEFWEMNIKRNR